MNHNSCILSIFTAICFTVIYSIFILSYYVMICPPLTRILKFECCSCNQYAPDEERDGRNVEIINQQSYIGVGLLTITFLLLFTLFQEPTIALVILQAASCSPISILCGTPYRFLLGWMDGRNPLFKYGILSN